MLTNAPRALLLVLVGVIGLSASCTTAPSAAPSQAVCDGISSEVGGCTAERHTFIETTCAGLAREWATVLDRQVVAILTGPPNPGEAVSSRLKQAVTIVTLDMQTKLQELGLVPSCDVPEFMAAAEPAFSAVLRAKVGGGLWDGNPVVPYEDWLADVVATVDMIDFGESPASS